MNASPEHQRILLDVADLDRRIVQAERARTKPPQAARITELVAIRQDQLRELTALLNYEEVRGLVARIRAHLEASGVRLTSGSSVPAPTSTALARLDANGAATYEFDLLWDPRPVGLPECVDAVHTSSIAAVLEPGAATVLDVLHRHRETATISYDPNARPTLMGDPGLVRAQVEATISLSDVVKASD